MRGPRTIARAMHTRCRCPPDSCVVVTESAREGVVFFSQLVDKLLGVRSARGRLRIALLAHSKSVILLYIYDIHSVLVYMAFHVLVHMASAPRAGACASHY